jgi:hypothetical protein
LSRFSSGTLLSIFLWSAVNKLLGHLLYGAAVLVCVPEVRNALVMSASS